MNHSDSTLPTLSLRRVRASHSAVLVEVIGEVDLRTAPMLADFLRETGRRFDTVIADLSGVTFFDSAGAQALLSAHDEPAADPTRLEVVPSTAVRRIVCAAGLESTLRLHPSIDMARRAAGLTRGGDGGLLSPVTR